MRHDNGDETATPHGGSEAATGRFGSAQGGAGGDRDAAAERIPPGSEDETDHLPLADAGAPAEGEPDGGESPGAEALPGGAASGEPVSDPAADSAPAADGHAADEVSTIEEEPATEDFGVDGRAADGPTTDRPAPIPDAVTDPAEDSATVGADRRTGGAETGDVKETASVASAHGARPGVESSRAPAEGGGDRGGPGSEPRGDVAGAPGTPGDGHTVQLAKPAVPSTAASSGAGPAAPATVALGKAVAPPALSESSGSEDSGPTGGAAPATVALGKAAATSSPAASSPAADSTAAPRSAADAVRSPPEGTGDAAGRLLAGRYRLGSVVGRGGMGTVWRATDEVIGREVAVKELRLPPGIDDTERRRLVTRTLREAKAIATIRSRGVVTIFDVVDEGSRPWIVMELIEGRSLADAIRDDGPLTPRRTAEIGLSVLGVLAAAHRAGIVHRDVKPSNVLLSTADGRVVLTDFGIAKVEGDTSVTTTGMLVGAPSYISPERARGEDLGPAADYWSLGALLFCAVEGRPPYDRGNAISTLTAVLNDPVELPASAGALADVIDGLLLKDPEERFDEQVTRAMLREALRSLPDEEPTGGAAGTVGAAAGAAAGTAALAGSALAAGSPADAFEHAVERDHPAEPVGVAEPSASRAESAERPDRAGRSEGAEQPEQSEHGDGAVREDEGTRDEDGADGADDTSGGPSTVVLGRPALGAAGARAALAAETPATGDGTDAEPGADADAAPEADADEDDDAPTGATTLVVGRRTDADAAVPGTESTTEGDPSGTPGPDAAASPTPPLPLPALAATDASGSPVTGASGSPSPTAASPAAPPAEHPTPPAGQQPAIGGTFGPPGATPPGGHTAALAADGAGSGSGRNGRRRAILIGSGLAAAALVAVLAVTQLGGSDGEPAPGPDGTEEPQEAPEPSDTDTDTEEDTDSDTDGPPSGDEEDGPPEEDPAPEEEPEPTPGPDQDWEPEPPPEEGGAEPEQPGPPGVVPDRDPDDPFPPENPGGFPREVGLGQGDSAPPYAG